MSDRKNLDAAVLCAKELKSAGSTDKEIKERPSLGRVSSSLNTLAVCRA